MTILMIYKKGGYVLYNGFLKVVKTLLIIVVQSFYNLQRMKNYIRAMLYRRVINFSDKNIAKSFNSIIVCSLYLGYETLSHQYLL